jgi:hypothetical protein
LPGVPLDRCCLDMGTWIASEAPALSPDRKGKSRDRVRLVSQTAPRMTPTLMLVFDVSDDRLDGGAPPHLALDLRGDAALLFGRRLVQVLLGATPKLAAT